MPFTLTRSPATIVTNTVAVTVLGSNGALGAGLSFINFSEQNNGSALALGWTIQSSSSGVTPTAQTAEKLSQLIPASGEASCAINWATDPTLGGTKLAIGSVETTNRRVGNRAWRAHPRYPLQVQNGAVGLSLKQTAASGVDVFAIWSEPWTNPPRSTNGRRGRRGGHFVDTWWRGVSGVTTEPAEFFGVGGLMLAGSEFDVALLCNLMNNQGGGNAFTITLNESITTADFRTSGAVEVLAEASTLADVVAKLAGALNVESLSLSDIIARLAGKLNTEAATLTDGVTKSVAGTVVAPESLSLLDVALKAAGKLLTPEGLTLADTLLASRTFIRTLLETVASSDVLLKLAGKTDVEAVTLADVLAKAGAKTPVESVALGDALTKLAGKADLESLSLLDSILTAIVRGRTFTETLTTADALARLAGKSGVEKFTLTDVATKAASKNLPEGVTLSDVLLASRVFLRTLLESVTPIDAVLKAVTQGARVEATTLADTLVKAATKLYAETATLTDLRTSLAGKVLADSVTLSDVLTAIRVTLKTLSEALTLTDVAGKLVGKLEVEAATLSDTRTAATVHQLAEAATLADSCVKAGARSYIEALSLLDVALKGAGKMSTEAVTLADGRVAFVVGKVDAETLLLTDTTVKAAAHQLLDLLSMLDVLTTSGISPRVAQLVFLLAEALLGPKMDGDALAASALYAPGVVAASLAGDTCVPTDVSGDMTAGSSMTGDGLVGGGSN